MEKQTENHETRLPIPLTDRPGEELSPADAVRQISELADRIKSAPPAEATELATRLRALAARVPAMSRLQIRYDSLDAAVRAAMASEIQRDQANGNLYISPRLTDAGAQAWPDLLLEASAQHDDAWLAAALRSRGYVRTEEQRRKPKGGFTVATVPYTAPDTLAQGEFNRFYARGLCAQVLESGGTDVEVYRGKEVENPRPESQAMIGRRLPAQQLLNDLRTSPGVEPALGLPPGPNSGLTVRRV